MSFGEGDLRARVDRLMDANGALCAEVNRQERRIRRLEALARDMAALLPCAPAYMRRELESEMDELGVAR